MTGILSSYFKKSKEEMADHAFLLALTLVIVSLPFSIRLNSISIVLLIVCWGVQNNFSRLLQVVKSNRLFWFNISLYLLSVISMLYTQNKHDGKFELEKEFSLLLFPILLASAKLIPLERIIFILWSFVLANFVLGALGILYAVYGYWKYDLNYFFYHDLVRLFNFHATYFSMYLLFSIVILVYLFIINKKEYGTILKSGIILIITFFIVLIFLLSVRSIIVFFCLSTLVSIIVYTIRMKNVKLGFLLLSGFITIVYFGINKNEVLKDRLLQIKDNYKYEFSRGDTNIYNGFTTRLAQWECSFIIIKKSPFFGVGIGDVQDELQIQYKKNILNYSFKGRFNAHNQYFQTGLGLGIVGLLIFMGGFVLALILSYRQKNYVYLVFSILFYSCCLTESMLCMQQGVVFYAFFNALFTFHTFQREITIEAKDLSAKAE